MSFLAAMAQLDSPERRKRIAWEKAHIVLGCDPDHTRKDDFGWFIEWSSYGDRNSPWGWEIDHAQPTILGGSDSAPNLRALHWHNNASLGGLLSGIRR